MAVTRDFDGVAANTYDGPPTLTDTQVLEVCREGYLILPGIIPDEINARTVEYMSRAESHEPSEIILEDWFREGVLLAPEAAGAVRSLLGAGFGLPVLMSSHEVTCPEEAQGWHHDADSKFGPELNYLQVFYYPQETPAEMGPTEVAPRSHVAKTSRATDWTGGVSTASPAGSVFVTVYPILHRRARATGSGVRHLLKYKYWRTVASRLGHRARLRLPERVLRRTPRGVVDRPHVLLDVRGRGAVPDGRWARVAVLGVAAQPGWTVVRLPWVSSLGVSRSSCRRQTDTP